ncbi:hypothetical protein WN55_10061 [Dufourea novaeangliae]|uniref:Uncharacterized protein n=1 Tax=Dufourea novaeangliae TaxID=178035 RepID=A0A154PAH2_DUFNO|nr:hypothetical protein WN55_10061 [Dufourea novaeangliae]
MDRPVQFSTWPKNPRISDMRESPMEEPHEWLFTFPLKPDQAQPIENAPSNSSLAGHSLFAGGINRGPRTMMKLPDDGRKNTRGEILHSGKLPLLDHKVTLEFEFAPVMESSHSPSVFPLSRVLLPSSKTKRDANLSVLSPGLASVEQIAPNDAANSRTAGRRRSQKPQDRPKYIACCKADSVALIWAERRKRNGEKSPRWDKASGEVHGKIASAAAGAD